MGGVRECVWGGKFARACIQLTFWENNRKFYT